MAAPQRIASAFALLRRIATLAASGIYAVSHGACDAMGALLILAHLAAAALSATTLGPDTIGRLVVADDRVVPNVLVEQLADWAGAVVVGATEPVSGRPLIVLIDAPSGLPPALPAPAAPYFALSPDGRRLAYWRFVPTAEGNDCAQLVALSLADGTFSVLSPPQLITAGGSLCWPTPSNVVFTAVRPLPDGRAGLVWRLDLGTGASYCLFSRAQATRAGRVWPTGDPTTVGYVDMLGAALVPITGSEPQPADAAQVLWRRPGTETWLALKPRVSLQPPQPDAHELPFSATSAAWAPGGAAVLLAARGSLFAAPADLSFARKLTGWSGPASDFTRLLWRPSLVDIAVACLGPKPALHLASLATETLTATIFFPTQSPPPEMGTRVWIALDFQRNEFGAIVKPKWETLKACFAVTAARHSHGGLLVEAENVGKQGGELERLRASASAAGSVSEIATVVRGRRIVWVRRYSVAPRQDLRAWIDGLPALGQLRSLQVEVRRLDAP